MYERQLTELFFETPKDIQHNSFKNLSVLELIEIMSFLEKTLKTEKGNWSTQRAIEYANTASPTKDNTHTFYLHLVHFCNEYSRRKKQKVLFIRFIQRFKKKLLIDSKRNKNKKKIELIEKQELANFLKDMQRIKIKYLKITDAEWINFIHKRFETQYKVSYIKNLYYKKKK